MYGDGFLGILDFIVAYLIVSVVLYVAWLSHKEETK